MRSSSAQPITSSNLARALSAKACCAAAPLSNRQSLRWPYADTRATVFPNLVQPYAPHPASATHPMCSIRDRLEILTEPPETNATMPACVPYPGFLSNLRPQGTNRPDTPPCPAPIALPAAHAGASRARAAHQEMARPGR